MFLQTNHQFNKVAHSVFLIIYLISYWTCTDTINIQNNLNRYNSAESDGQPIGSTQGFSFSLFIGVNKSNQHQCIVLNSIRI